MSILDCAESVALTIGDDFAEMPVTMLRHAKSALGGNPNNKAIVRYLRECEGVIWEKTGLNGSILLFKYE